MSKMASRILSAIFKQLKARPTFESVGIKPYRELLEKSAAVFKPDPGVTHHDFFMDHIQARWMTPEKPDPSRTILYIHGGGFIAGSIKSHTDLAARIARACRARVLIFNYRLAPEHPFPSGIKDVGNMYRFLTGSLEDGQRICLMGDSAGGGLGLALLADLLKNKAAVLPACAVFISPWADLECKNPSHSIEKDADPMLSQSVLKKTARLYTDQDPALPEISPINSDFTGACPVLIQVGENEVLKDDSIILSDRMKDAGVTVELEIWQDMFHVWHYFARYLSEGREAIDRIGKFTAAHMG